MEKVREKVLFALQEVQRAVIGKQEVTETVMKAFLAGGHVLVEDIPGLGKTTMAQVIASEMGVDFKDLIFDPGEDVMPEPTTVVDLSEGYAEVVRVGAGDPAPFE